MRVATLHRRQAFTLLELLLVLAVLAAVASVAIPQAGILLGDRELVRSAEQVRIQMTRLRVDAMREGRIMMLQGMLEGNSLRSKPFFSMADSTEALDQTGSQSGLLTGAQQGLAVAPVQDAAMQEAQAGKTIEIGEDVVFQSVATVSAARSFQIEQAAAADAASGWSTPILFYPDGTTSTAAVTLSHATMGRIVIKLRGITGDASVGEVLP